MTPAQEKLRARHLSATQVTRLEEAWKARPEARVEDLDAPGEDEEAAPVALRYEVRVNESWWQFHNRACGKRGRMTRPPP